MNENNFRIYNVTDLTSPVNLNDDDYGIKLLWPNPFLNFGHNARQRQYPIIIKILSVLRFFWSNILTLDSSTFTDRAFRYSQCGTTHNILDRLFTTQKGGHINRTDLGNFLETLTTEMALVTIALGGRNFPDHIFHYIELFNEFKQKREFYIFQSYYEAYSLNGAYGLMQLSKTESVYFKQLISSYKALELNPNAPYNVQQLNKMFQRYTGVNSQFHKLDNRVKCGNPNITTDYEILTSFDSLFNNLNTIVTDGVRRTMDSFRGKESLIYPMNLWFQSYFVFEDENGKPKQVVKNTKTTKFLRDYSGFVIDEYVIENEGKYKVVRFNVLFDIRDARLTILKLRKMADILCDLVPGQQNVCGNIKRELVKF